MPAIGQSNFLQSLGWAVLNSLWQMALLWIVFQLILGIHRNARSWQKSALAATMLFTGFGWFAYTLLTHWLLNPQAISFSGTSGFALNSYAELNKWLYTTLPFASVIYLILLILPVLRFTRNYRYVQILRKYGLNKINVEWRVFVQRVSAQMNINKKVSIWVSDLVNSPVTIGYLKPVILVPLAAINHLTPQQLEAVLLHELAHIKRHDYFVNLLITCIQTILYYNPFVKLFVKCIEREREKSCDESVMEFQYDPHGYASALLMLEKSNAITRSMAIAASGKKHDLLTRIECIMGVEKKPIISFNKIAGVFAGLLCIIALNALLILSKPQAPDSPISFAHLANPFYFIGNDKDEEHENGVPALAVPLVHDEADVKTIITTAAPVITASAEHKTVIHHPALLHAANSNHTYFTDNVLPPSPFMQVSFVATAVPELKDYQKEEVKEAVEATKIVLGKAQVKEIEVSAADALTQLEKEQVKLAFKQELEKVNWQQLERRLQQSYENINWDKVNSELNTAIACFKLDSLQLVYTTALKTLNKVETFVTTNECQEVIHPELSLEVIKERKRETERTLNKLRAIRDRKVIHL